MLQIGKVLAHVAKKERLQPPAHVSLLLARLSGGNLRRALLSFEALVVQDNTFSRIKRDAAETENINKTENLDVVPRPDWEKYCSKVAERILSDQTPDRLYEVRGMLYELLVHCIPANVVLAVSPCNSWRADSHLSDLTDHRKTSDGPRGRRVEATSRTVGSALRSST